MASAEPSILLCTHRSSRISVLANRTRNRCTSSSIAQTLPIFHWVSSSGWLSSHQHGGGSSHGSRAISPGISLTHHCQDIKLVHLQPPVDSHLAQPHHTPWQARQLLEHHPLSRCHHQYNPIWPLPLLQAHLWLQHHRQLSSQ